MRIDPQIQNADPARRAPGANPFVPPAANAETAADYRALLALLSGDPADSEAGPAGIAAAAERQLNDPLGLATERAAVTPGDSPLLAEKHAAPKPTPTADRAPGGDVAQRAHESIDPHAGVRREGAVADPRATRQHNASQTPQNEPTANNSAGKPNAAPAAAAQAPNAPGVPATNSNSRGGTPGVQAIGSASGSGANSGSASNAGSQSANSATLPGIGSLAQNQKAQGLKNASQAAPNPSMLRTEQAEIAPQVAKGLASLVLKDGGQAQIQLRPEALGRVDLDLAVKDGVVRATLRAENETARELLTEQLDRLRSLLEQRGLRVESLEVADADGERGALADADDRRGGRWMSAQDDPRDTGREAGQGTDHRPPGDGGGDRRARGGAPTRSAERDGALGSIGSAEAGTVRTQADTIATARWDPGAMAVRLDTVA